MVVVTGPTGGGKTAVVTAVAERLRAAGVTVAGFVQPGIFDGEAKAGFGIRDLATGDEAVLASLSEGEKGDFGTRFSFSEDGFRLGREALGRATSSSIVIIDELGPIELRGQGHMPAVREALVSQGLDVEDGGQLLCYSDNRAGQQGRPEQVWGRD